jgi:polynucleotide 5'-hydroxyl-kinase GRC3/NOL9
VGEEWEVAVTSLRLVTANRQQPRLLVAGGKGVGKSTFVRWMANRLLASSTTTYAQVIYLDLDPGQREFGLPGYVSLTVLDSPLLGRYRSNVNIDGPAPVPVGCE